MTTESSLLTPSAAGDAQQTQDMAATSVAGPIRTALKRAASPIATTVSSSSSSSASISTRPLSGIFGINKPSGPTSMSLLDDLKPLFASSPLFADADGKRPKDQSRKRGKYGKHGKGNKWAGGVAGAPKLGQGGTLDPLADGVLVIGVGNGTKHLQKYLDCTKAYRTTGLLGSATTSYDSCDPILTRKPYEHVTPETIAQLLPKFTGKVSQIPPLYSAVRIDGKRLFEYARENIPLPRPIEPRKVTVEELRLVEWLDGGCHDFKEPDREVPEEDKALVGRVMEVAGRSEGQTDTVKEDVADASVPSSAAARGWKRISSTSATTLDKEQSAETPKTSPPAFTLEMTVSSGTYVRSIVHDLGLAAGSAAHVQKLTRTRQGEWSIDTPAQAQTATDLNKETAAEANDEATKGNCMDWKVFADAIQQMQKEKDDPSFRAERDEQGLRSWERELLKVITPV